MMKSQRKETLAFKIVVCAQEIAGLRGCSWKIVTDSPAEHFAGHRAATKAEGLEHMSCVIEDWISGHPTMLHADAEAAGHCTCEPTIA